MTLDKRIEFAELKTEKGMTPKEIIASWHRDALVPADGDREIVTYFGPIDPVKAIAPEVERAAAAGITIASAELRLKRPLLIWLKEIAIENHRWLVAEGVPAFRHPRIGGIASRDAGAIGIVRTRDPGRAVEVAAPSLPLDAGRSQVPATGRGHRAMNPEMGVKVQVDRGAGHKKSRELLSRFLSRVRRAERDTTHDRPHSLHPPGRGRPSWALWCALRGLV